MLVFEERGKPQNPEKNLLEKRREPSTKATHMVMVSMCGFELGPLCSLVPSLNGK